MPDLGASDVVAPVAADHYLIRRNSDGEIVRSTPAQVSTGAPFGGADISDAVLKQENYQFTSITYDADQVPVSGNVLWFDGSAGVYTTTSIDATHLMINSYTVTHTTSGKTVTQPAITRDANGNPTVVPEKTVA